MEGLNTKSLDKLEEYFADLYKWEPEGGHDSASEIRGVLGTQMKKLYSLSLEHESRLEKCLKKIIKERKSEKSLECWKNQYHQYLLILSKRQEYIVRHNNTKSWFCSKLDDVESLSESNWNLWGSVRQLKFGKVIVDTLGVDLDPVFGALLSPTGGIVGPGNLDVYNGDHQDCIVMHGITHDAGGYLLNYHRTGPGYNYINTPFTLFPTSSPFSTQYSGIKFWKKFIKRMIVEKKNIFIKDSDE